MDLFEYENVALGIEAEPKLEVVVQTMESTNYLLTNSPKTTLLSDAKLPDTDVAPTAVVADDDFDIGVGNGFWTLQCTRKIVKIVSNVFHYVPVQ